MTKNIYVVGNIRIGGKMGQYPTVLVGCMFYRKHKIVIDPIKGLFERNVEENLVNIQESLSEDTGIPAMIDIFGETDEALARYVEFVLDISDLPILLNGATAEVRIKSLEKLRENGLLTERIIYTSLNYTSNEREIFLAKKYGIKYFIVQTFNPRNPFPQGHMEFLLKNGFLKILSKHGVDKIILMPTVLDIPGIGIALETIKLFHNRLDYPTAIAPLGVIGYWWRARENRELKKLFISSILGYILSTGVDIIIYGAIRKAKYVFPSVALINSIEGYIARNRGIRLEKNHPFNRYLRKSIQ